MDLGRIKEHRLMNKHASSKPQWNRSETDLQQMAFAVVLSSREMTSEERPGILYAYITWSLYKI